MGAEENNWPKYSYNKKQYCAEIKPIREYTRDYTYGRLYNESRFYLNKSGSKFISIGIHPGVGVFRREIRLHTTGAKPYSVVLTPMDLKRMFETIYEMPEMRKTEIEGAVKMDVDVMCDGSSDGEDDDDDGRLVSNHKKLTEGAFELRKTELGSDVYKLTLPNSQFMFMGQVSLQKLLDLQSLIYLMYRELDAPYLKSLYDKLIEDLSVDDYPIHKIADIITDALQREAVSNWNDRSFYLQTAIHFTDFVVAHIAFLRNKQNK